MALLLLAAEWCKKHRHPPPLAFTVDHGLRTDSADEAARVGRWAHEHGVVHETLAWRGRKPAKNIQALAREARYRLIADRMCALGMRDLLTGHTMDDQAETFLLRLARGSGLDGLAGMAAASAFPLQEAAGLKLQRPLLAFSHVRLIATLRARKQQWIEDPSNTNERFARVQIRKLMPALAEAGLSADRIAAATAHLRRAREAIEVAVAALLANGTDISPWGYALVRTDVFAAAPREVSLRALAHLIAAVGGEAFPPRFEQTEPALAWLTAPKALPKGRTLGGCRLVRRDQQTVLIAREETAQAQADPRTQLKAGNSALWDGRYAATLTQATGDEAFELRRLGPVGLKAAGKRVSLPPVEPHRIAVTVPALWRGERLISAPLLGVHTAGVSFSASFAALSRRADA